MKIIHIFPVYQKGQGNGKLPHHCADKCHHECSHEKCNNRIRDKAVKGDKKDIQVLKDGDIQGFHKIFSFSKKEAFALKKQMPHYKKPYQLCLVSDFKHVRKLFRLHKRRENLVPLQAFSYQYGGTQLFPKNPVEKYLRPT
jgi:hypothetical protein